MGQSRFTVAEARGEFGIQKKGNVCCWKPLPEEW
jgi:hypothetical protein